MVRSLRIYLNIVDSGLIIGLNNEQAGLIWQGRLFNSEFSNILQSHLTTSASGDSCRILIES